MNRDDERDELWRLLGKARKPVVSPFFTRNVLRAIRQTPQQPAGWFGWLWLHWRPAALATAAAALALLLAVQITGTHPLSARLAAVPEEPADSIDYEIIGSLDELLAFQNTSLWLEDDTF